MASEAKANDHMLAVLKAMEGMTEPLDQSGLGNSHRYIGCKSSGTRILLRFSWCLKQNQGHVACGLRAVRHQCRLLLGFLDGVAATLGFV